MEDRYFYVETPDFMTCFEEYREDLFRSSKLKLSEKGESPKGKKEAFLLRSLGEKTQRQICKEYTERDLGRKSKRKKSTSN